MRLSELKEIMKWTIDWCKWANKSPGGTRMALMNVFPSCRVYVDSTTGKATIKGWVGDQFVNLSMIFK